MFLGNLIRKIKAPSKTLLKNTRYSFYNEVPKFDPTKDYYSILEISKGASESQMKRSYYKLAKQYHPDSNPGLQAKFKQINEAYQVLSDQKLKKQYEDARQFNVFSRRMRGKANEGAYSYEQYRSVYEEYTPQQKEKILKQAKKKLQKIVIFGVIMIVVLPFLTRKNHRYYILNNNELLPVFFQGGRDGGYAPPNMIQPPYPGPQGGMDPGMRQGQGQPQNYNPYADVVRNIQPPNPYAAQPNYPPQGSGYPPPPGYPGYNRQNQSNQ